MRIARWGNSLAVRLPASVVDALALSAGDQVEIHVAGTRAFEVARTPDTETLLARVRRLRGRLPNDFVFDRLEANAR